MALLMHGPSLTQVMSQQYSVERLDRLYSCQILSRMSLGLTHAMQPIQKV